MTKRTRGTSKPTTHRRPGTRPAVSRPAMSGTPAAITRPSQLEAAEIVAEDVLEHKPASAAEELRAVGKTAVQPRTRVKPGSLLAARAATEYVYVAQDLRRIGLVAASLFGVLVLLWLLLVVAGFSPLY